MKDKCPKCGSTHIQIERAMQGYTKCDDCDYRAPHEQWNIRHDIRDVFPRSPLYRVLISQHKGRSLFQGWGYHIFLQGERIDESGYETAEAALDGAIGAFDAHFPGLRKLLEETDA